jgi:signal transduction histidine kinase
MKRASSYNDVVKHNVLTGFNRFVYLALIAIVINIIDSVQSGYGEYYDVYVLSVTSVLLLGSLLLHSRGFTFWAKVISLMSFNVAFFLISLELGIRSATYLYYFPLILVYIYLFRSEGSKKYVLLFSGVTILFLLLSLILADDHFQFPANRLIEAKRTFYLSFFLSFALTVYYFILIYNYQEKLYSRILVLENDRRKQELRSVIEKQETDNQNIVYALRDNINQTLAAVKMYQGEAMQQQYNNTLLEKSYSLTDEAMRDVSKLCMQLHPAVIADIGLIEGMKDYAASLQSLYKVQVQFVCREPLIEQIPLQDKLSVFRIIQDYLDITLQHSAASTIKTEILYSAEKITLRLSQNDPQFRFLQQLKATAHNSINNRVTYYNGHIDQLLKGESETIVIHLQLV